MATKTPIQQDVARLMNNLGGSLPAALLSQYLPFEYEAIRNVSLENSATEIVRYHIQRVLKSYAVACGTLAPVSAYQGDLIAWQSKLLNRH
jgi:D-tagatose-1,6-bisphosphate aldolase subunit GatZ/KbaZ